MTPLEYSVLRFTPDPETVEPVNVALVLWDQPPQMLIDDKLPRLSCLAEYVEPDLVREYLEDVRLRLRQTSLRDMAAIGLSSQFQFFDGGQLLSRPSEHTYELLRDKYLRKHRAPAVVGEMRTQERVEAAIDTFLREKLHVLQADVLKQASPKDFLSSQVFRELGGNGFRVARAIRGRHDLVLIDGVNLGQRNFQQAELRAQHVAANFFRLDRIRQPLANIEQRTLKTATVLFGKEPPKKRSNGEFLRTMLQPWSTFLVDPDSPSTDFISSVERASGHLI